MSKTNNKYGWIPDLPDHRDVMYSVSVPVIGVLPAKADLRDMCPNVYDQGELGSCHDDQTEVLTDLGWKFFSSLSNDDKLATVNPQTSVLTFELPSRLIKMDYNGDMFYGEHKSLDFAVTPDHKMLVRKWSEGKRELELEYQLISMKDIGWYVGLMSGVISKGSENANELYVLKGVSHRQKYQRSNKSVDMKVWLNFVGIYLAEGTILQETRRGKSNYKIQIAASKPRERGFVIDVLSKLNVKPCVLSDRFTFSNKRIYKALENMGLKGIKAPDKFVPDFVFELPGDMIEHILYGHFMGDGCEQDGHISHYTSSKRLADDLQRLALLTGKWSNIGSRPPRTSVMKDGRVVKGKHPEYRVGIWGGEKGLSIARKSHITIKNYKGIVYCAEMPTYHTIVTRRNGKILISGNCTANAIGGAHQFNQIKQKAPVNFVPSRLFIYFNERAMERTVDEDSGAMIRDGVKSIVRQGVCPETEWPYDVGQFKTKPSTQCYTHALTHQLISYQRLLTSLPLMKSCLANGFPFVFGFAVYESFELPSVAKTGMMPMPSGSQMGGHAVMAVGYDDSINRVIVRNSWGAGWGDKGYFYMPYEYITNTNLCDDFWTIRNVEV